MTRPGTLIQERLSVPASTPPTGTGRVFIVGQAAQGPLAPQRVASLDEFVKLFGARNAATWTYDVLDAFLRESGNEAWIARVTAAAAVTATRTLLDSGNAACLTVNANGPGAWGNQLLVAVVAGSAGGTYNITVTIGGTVVEQSPDLTTNADAVAWSARSTYLRITSLNGNAPKVQAGGSLASGADGSVVDADFVTALTRIGPELGAGQVYAPGQTSQTVQLAVLAHAKANNRFAILDGILTAQVSTLTAQAAGLAGDTARFGSLYAPWLQVDGLAPGTTRVVPPGATVAGMMARTDATFGPGQPAAGDVGVSVGAIDVMATFLDSERDTLNTAGVCVLRNMFGSVRLYGYRTLANQQTQREYLQASQVRVLMGIKDDANAIAEAQVFKQIDGAGIEFSAYGNRLKGMLLRYYSRGELYGATPDDAFAVDTKTVNTPTTIANGEIHAAVGVRISPYGELVIVEIVKTSITQPIAA